MSAWRAELDRRAAQPPLRQRMPLLVVADGHEVAVGSVEPSFIEAFKTLRHGADGPLLTQLSQGWRINGDATEGLNQLAAEMRQRQLAGAWRDEQLAVNDAAGHRVATVERAAVRPLGIVTHAVHLMGFAPDGRVWVQQRALDKANDPGLWDTLMGGMVPASDSLELALQRETWEEAGLRMEQLHDLRAGGRVTTRRPCEDGGGTGYVEEHIDWFTATVPNGVDPQNQDGEVAQFALLAPGDVMDAVRRGEYTLEASLILADALPER